MNLKEWVGANRHKFGSEHEILFAERVLPLVPELSLEAIEVQYPFQDIERKQRYCDFVIDENEDVRIAIEIDGYDKRGTGTGMSHADFIDWQRRQAALTAQGWYVLRFANRDVRDNPKLCAEHISLLLRHTKSKSNRRPRDQPPTPGLTLEERNRLDQLNVSQGLAINHLTQATKTMRTTVAAFTAIVAMLVLVIAWQGGSRPEPQVVMVQAPPVAPAPVATAPNQIAAVAPAVPPGSNCEAPIAWQRAGQYVGQTVAVVGPVMRITRPNNIKGNPTWVDVGASYPNSRRLGLVIWGDHAPSFPQIQPGQLSGTSVCVVGLVKDYKGMPQIELRQASQFRVAFGAKF